MFTVFSVWGYKLTCSVNKLLTCILCSVYWLLGAGDVSQQFSTIFLRRPLAQDVIYLDSHNQIQNQQFVRPFFDDMVDDQQIGNTEIFT
jgi:hypothetical protein